MSDSPDLNRSHLSSSPSLPSYAPSSSAVLSSPSPAVSSASLPPPLSPLRPLSLSSLSYPYPRVLTTLYCCSFVGLGMLISAFGPALLELADRCEVEITAMSSIFAARSISYLIGSAIGGPLYDHYDGHRLLSFSISVSSLSMISIPFLQGIYALGTVVFIQGAVLGVMDAGTNCMLFWLYQGTDGSQVFIQLLHFSFALGAFVAPLAMGQLTTMIGAERAVSWSFIAFGAFYIPVVLAHLLLPSPTAPFKQEPPSASVTDPPSSDLSNPSPALSSVDPSSNSPTFSPSMLSTSPPLTGTHPGRTRRNPSAVLAMLDSNFTQERWIMEAAYRQHMEQVEERESRSNSLDVTISPMTIQPYTGYSSTDTTPNPTQPSTPSLRQLSESNLSHGFLHNVLHPLSGFDSHERWVMGLTAMFLFWYIGAEVSAGGYIYSYLISMGLTDEHTASLINSVFWGGLTIGRFFAIFLSTRLPPAFMMKLNVCGCLLACVLFVHGATNVQSIWIGSGLYGLSMASQFPTALLLAEQLMGKINGKAISLLVVAASLGEMFIPIIIAVTFSMFGFVSFFYTLLAITCLAALSAIAIGIKGPRPDPAIELARQHQLVAIAAFKALHPNESHPLIDKQQQVRTIRNKPKKVLFGG